MITSENFRTRRKKLTKLVEQSLIVITGGDLVQKSSDETYEFEQDGYFYYLTGIDAPGWILVVNVEAGSEFLISTDESSYHNEVWEDKDTHEDIARISGIDDIRGKDEGWDSLNGLIKGKKAIASIVPHDRFLVDFGMFINPSKIALVERLRSMHRGIEVVDTTHHIRTLRTIKDDDEIAKIRKAVAITKLGLDAVTSKLSEYKHEFEIVADLTHSFTMQRSRHGYAPVVAHGNNASIIHYRSNNSPIETGKYLLIDVGARAGRYSADVTRTFAVGDVSERHKQIYNTVKEAQAVALEFIRPGVTMRESEMNMEKFLGNKLSELGIIDTVLRKNIRTYYPHALSHHLGIDIHDSCDYDQPFAPGMVVTVEPGIYLPDEGVGVRIEDDILITDTGIEILTKDIEKA